MSASSTTTMRMTNGQARQIAGSAGDVKDRADLPSLEARDQPAGLFRRDSDKVNASARSFRHHLGHDRQRVVGPGADDQPASAPRQLLVGRKRSVSELVAVWLRGLLGPFAHGASVEDDVVLVRSSLDLDRPEPAESHIHHIPPITATSAYAEGKPRLLADNLVAECRPRLVGLVDGDREDHLTLADRHFPQTLDVHARVGEFPADLWPLGRVGLRT